MNSNTQLVQQHEICGKTQILREKLKTFLLSFFLKKKMDFLLNDFNGTIFVTPSTYFKKIDPIDRSERTRRIFQYPQLNLAKIDTYSIPTVYYRYVAHVAKPTTVTELIFLTIIQFQSKGAQTTDIDSLQVLPLRFSIREYFQLKPRIKLENLNSD